ncbi:MAG: helix-turn-helix domain-containing protein [Sporichthyaceae bacterium]
MRALDVTSGELLRRARKTSGLTQRELATRAGVSQSVIAAYESGAREPALSTLAALIEAAGVVLEVELAPATTPPLPIGGPIGRRLLRRRAAVLEVAARHGVSGLRVFGSVARGDERPGSDLDLLARLPEGMGLFGLGRFVEELEELLKVPVDVVPEGSLKPRVRERVEHDLVAL